MPARAAACSAVLLALGLLATAQAAAPPHTPARQVAREVLPPIRHVFVLLLENQSYHVTFGEGSPASYLARVLPARGALLTHYYAIGHASLGNYIALVSGQAPNLATQLDCPTYEDFRPRTPQLDEHGQLPGSGCVYPRIVRSLPDQLESAGFSWRAYMEDMGKNPARESSTCGHVRLGAPETTNSAAAGDQYAAKHNPFVYFHAIIDDQARCDTHVVNLERLPQDLASVATTANYIFITPNLCSDGHDVPCI
ncbi:MAG TPA: alkaline phosphatase family protein, partial [Steroidobacteraceae bacterium]